MAKPRAKRRRNLQYREEATHASPVQPTPDRPRARPRARPHLIAIVLIAFAVGFTALEVSSYRLKSATWDEPIHLTTGYMALTQQDYRVDASHPPFLRIWAALPLLAMQPRTPDTSIDAMPAAQWLESGAYDFARRFLYVENDADRLLYAARFMVVIWGVLAGILLFSWAYEWLGFAAAVLALGLYSIEPNIAAHASLVTTDFGATCFMFGAVYFLWRTSRQVTAMNLAGLAAFCALAIVSKFSALVLVPIVALLLAAAVWQRSAITMKMACKIALLLAAATFIGIWAAYGFRYTPSASPTWVLSLQETTEVKQQLPVIRHIVSWIDSYHLLPNAFTQGFLYSQATVNPGYLAGSYSLQGWWYYFPVAFLIKTPIAFIVLLVAGLFAYVRRRGYLGLFNEEFVVLPAGLYLAVAMSSPLNIGLRHILPMYPFLLLIVAAAGRELIASRRRMARVVLGAAAVFWLVEFGSVYPNTLTFFNQLVGGPRNGFRYLADSNLGWGQHLKPLKRWMNRNGVSHINLAYFGQADPNYYGITCTHLPGAPRFAEQLVAKPRLPGYVAISSTVLSGVYLQPRWRLFYKPFHDLQPVAVVGNSIRVYWVNEWPTAAGLADPSDIDVRLSLADALLIAMQWYDQAVFHYREYLKYRPGDAGVMTRYAIALSESGNTDEGIQMFRRAVELAPGDERTRRNLEQALLKAGRPGGSALARR